MAFLIRALVSADRQRFMHGGYDLDLTYITPRIIAMGFPASGLELSVEQGVWRNSIDEVSMMLKKHHSGKYMIWNLSDRPYDYSIFEDQVMEFGFPDHHAPPINLLFKIMLSLYNWLKADPLNVAVIHCLGGKGRTGTVIGCYLLLTGLFDDPVLALEYFGNKRSAVALGVTQPDQKSCVGYFAKILQQKVVPYQVPYCLSKIVMYGVNQQQPFAFRPVIKLYDVRNYPKRRIYSTDCPEEAENNAKRWTNETLPNNAVVWAFPKQKMTVRGDVLIKVYHMPVSGGKKIFVFRFSFHTAFLDGGALSLTEAEFSTEKKFAAYRKDNLFVHLFFDEPTDGPSADDDAENAYVDSYYKMFQKIYSERGVAKLDRLDPTAVSSATPNPAKNSTTTPTTTPTSTPSTTSSYTTSSTSTPSTISTTSAGNPTTTTPDPTSQSIRKQKQKPLPPPPPQNDTTNESSNATNNDETTNGNFDEISLLDATKETSSETSNIVSPNKTSEENSEENSVESSEENSEENSEEISAKTTTVEDAKNSKSNDDEGKVESEVQQIETANDDV